ncbi:hypothetical protein CRUP_007512 [Coryphaenoides rupestris]|nr:hypothetical protein CRUP_007512 [Coryphaenoides rupestris]
MSGERFTPS